MQVKYCDNALKWKRIKVVCGKNCPLYPNKCPTIIIEDGTEKMTKKAIKALLELRDNEQTNK